MLSHLEITNFRCFDRHIIPFKQTNFLIGENNTGKSTVIEALRLVGIVQSRYKSLNYDEPPEWLESYVENMKVVKVSVEGIDLPPSQAIFHWYNEKRPAKISAVFQNKSGIDVYIGQDYKTYAIPFYAKDSPIQSKGEAYFSNIPSLAVLPQLRQIGVEEKKLEKKYVIRNLGSNLSSLHFRNEISLLRDAYLSEFSRLVETSWGNLSVKELIDDEVNLGLIINEGKYPNVFPAEVGWLGSGLKMWLQILWFLTRTRSSDTIVLDEPDIYLHSDMQRRLLRLLRNTGKQVILTTHSSELLFEASPEEVLVVNKNSPKSEFTTNLPAVQEILTQMGSPHSLQLSKIWDAKRIIFIEGEDMKILSKIHEKIFPETTTSLANIPHLSLGGYDGWPKVIGISELLRKSSVNEIKKYCIFDKDYHTEEELEERREKAKENGIQLHIWRKKEIENYLLTPEIITNAVNGRLKAKRSLVEVDEIKKGIEDCAEMLKKETVLKFGNKISPKYKREEFSTVYVDAEKFVDDHWNSLEEKTSMVSGKDLRTAIIIWVRNNFKVSLSQDYILHSLRPGDLDSEITRILKSIYYNSDFE